jgi:hypothetical protein
MIKIRYRATILLLFGLLISACDQVATSSNSDTEGVILGESALLQHFTPVAGVPSEAFSLTQEDYMTMARQEAATDARIPSPDHQVVLAITFEDLEQTLRVLQARFPSLDTPSEGEVQRVAQDFEGLTQGDIRTNLDEVRGIYEAQLRYLFFQEVVRLLRDAPRTGTSTSLGGYDFPYGLNSQEVWLLASNPLLISGTRQASERALQYARSYGDSSDGWRGNAYQHAIWNILIVKYTGHRFSSLTGAKSWAKRFTDAHEYGSPAPSPTLLRDMDIHNNAAGRTKVSSVCEVDDDEVDCDSTTTIRDLVEDMADGAFKFRRVSQLSNLGSRLAFHYPQ